MVMRNKSIAPLTFILIGLIAGISIIMSILIFIFTFKYHVYIDLNFEYDKSLSDLVMLSLLRLNYKDNYPAYRVLSERNVNGLTSDMRDFIMSKISVLADTNCSKLVNKTSVIVQSKNCEPVEYTGSAFIFKPYNPDSLVEEIVLTYNKVRR